MIAKFEPWLCVDYEINIKDQIFLKCFFLFQSKSMDLVECLSFLFQLSFSTLGKVCSWEKILPLLMICIHPSPLPNNNNKHLSDLAEILC